MMTHAETVEQAAHRLGYHHTEIIRSPVCPWCPGEGDDPTAVCGRAFIRACMDNGVWRVDCWTRSDQAGGIDDEGRSLRSVDLGGRG